MLRTPHHSERIQMIDPATGIRVTQITSYPTPSRALFYAWPSITPDNRRVVIYCQRSGRRTAPYDIFRCDTNGLNLFQLTDWPGIALLSIDGKTVYVLSGEQILHEIDVETGRSEPLIDVNEHVKPPYNVSTFEFADMGREVLFGLRNSTVGGGTYFRVNLETGQTSHGEGDVVMIGCFQQSGRIEILKNYQRVEPIAQADGTRVFKNVRPEPMTIWSATRDGSDERFMARMDMFGHHTILGQTDRLQGTGQPPHRCIWIVESGKEPFKLAEGPYFWHSAASFDGEWIVADTSWPDEGLKLVHVPTGHWRTLCHPHAEQDHAGVHPHPGISQDGRKVVFASDRTGVPQLYIAHITEEFRQSVIAGELDRPRDKWI